jgi:hypothetical protein
MYLFVDWKTSRKGWDIEKKLKDNGDFFAQLGFYKYFYCLKNNIPFNKIEVKFYNLPREEPDAQNFYKGILTEEYVKFLYEKLTNVCTDIYKKNFMELDKAKHTTKKNFCHRCNFNTEALCNGHDDYQIII